MIKVSITVTGFVSKEEAIEWMNWYSEAGEQDASYWMEERCSENPDVEMRTDITCKSIDKEKLIMDVSDLELISLD